MEWSTQALLASAAMEWSSQALLTSIVLVLALVRLLLDAVHLI